MKLLLVGPSAKIKEYGIGYFKEKKEDGFEVLSYTGSIYHFKKIGFKPDYFSFIDPNTIATDIDLFERDSFFNNTNLLIADLYRNGFKDFFDKGFTCNNLKRQTELFKRTKTLKFLDNFKNVFAVEMKRVAFYSDEEGFHSVTIHLPSCHVKTSAEGPDFTKEFLFISEELGKNTDKFTCFLMPLAFYFFKDLKEIKTLGFGEFSYPRYKEQIPSLTGRGYKEFMESSERNLPLIKAHLKERDIKFSSETNNFFSERLR